MNLFSYQQDGNAIGCIGIEWESDTECVIKHIAVSRETRGTGIGRKLFQFLCERYSPDKITAETDKDAVDFYQTLGFRITTLGEKYPGVERFRCEYLDEGGD